jgi:hypothetical protein
MIAKNLNLYVVLILSGVFFACSVNAATYRSNKVTMKSDAVNFISGSYQITDFKITSGQDSDNHIFSGKTDSFTRSNPTMTYSIGRKGTSDVADWFTARISSSQNTFNHDPGKLNFAFIGTLTFKILIDGISSTYIFENIALAQGHKSSSNNWWFGGKKCSNIGSNTVRCNGVSSVGWGVTMEFKRGGNNVSTIEASPITLIDTANWMQGLSASTNLDQIMMPGSHDAGMSELHHCAPPIGAGGIIQTQSSSVEQQLLNGSRYFDIRVDYDHNELVTYHRTNIAGVGWGCNGQSLTSVLDQIKAFLSKHTGETVILKFSHIRNVSGHDPAVTKQKINGLLSNYSAEIYTNSTSRVNLAKVTIGNVKGKMILVFDYSEYIKPATGRFRYKDGSSIISGSNLTVYDKYSDTSDYNTMKTDQLQKWQSYGGLGTGHLFLLSWTLTTANPAYPISSLATEANSKLPDVLYDQIVSKSKPNPNIVYIDYMDCSSAKYIIQYNFGNIAKLRNGN